MTTELVKRVRDAARWLRAHNGVKSKHALSIDEAADALERAPAGVTEWQPIETLPAMQRAFVGYWMPGGHPHFYRAEGHWFEWQGKKEWSITGTLYEPPTLWYPLMRLPEPPAALTQKEGS